MVGADEGLRDIGRVLALRQFVWVEASIDGMDQILMRKRFAETYDLAFPYHLSQ